MCVCVCVCVMVCLAQFDTETHLVRIKLSKFNQMNKLI